MKEFAYVYILSSSFKHLYIGVTSTLEHRIRQHKTGAFKDSFTARYRIDQLVYFERHTDIRTAIAREKQLKRWSRAKKINLIIQQNPAWHDLSEDWGKRSTLCRNRCALLRASSVRERNAGISPLRYAPVEMTAWARCRLRAGGPVPLPTVSFLTKGTWRHRGEITALAEKASVEHKPVQP